LLRVFQDLLKMYNILWPCIMWF